MSAICAHADQTDWLKQRVAAESDNSPWPYVIVWPDQSSSLVTIVPDTWTTDYTTTNGFSMTLTPFPGSSATVFTFSFEDAEGGPVSATVLDGDNTPFTLTLQLITS